jgi:homocysteine S-methyltransferase
MTDTALNQLLISDKVFLADGGLETCMVFHEGLELPHFASFVLLESSAGRATLDGYFGNYIEIAKKSGAGFVLDTATWRANMGWAAALGLDEAAIREVNGRAAGFAIALRKAHATAGFPIIVNGVVGPSGDGYRIDTVLMSAQAEVVHRPQVQALAAAGVDMVTAVTMTHVGEAVGIARAAKAAGMPHVLSFTVEVDGHLPSGQPLQEALAETEAATGGSALFYMVNCAHPTHFARELNGPMRSRIGGIRANASRLSHAELDVATDLDDGDPVEFVHFYGLWTLPAEPSGRRRLLRLGPSSCWRGLRPPYPESGLSDRLLRPKGKTQPEDTIPRWRQWQPVPPPSSIQPLPEQEIRMLKQFSIATLAALLLSGAALADPLRRFDVAEDHTRFVFAPAPVHADGMPAYGNPFLTQGYIYEAGTLAFGGEGVNADGSPVFPDKVIGTWTCDGWYVGDGAHTKTGTMIVSRQVFQFDDGGIIVSQGVELADYGVPMQRVITGSLGEYADLDGVLVQTNLGMSEGFGIRAQFEIPTAQSSAEHDMPVDVN